MIQNTPSTSPAKATQISSLYHMPELRCLGLRHRGRLIFAIEVINRPQGPIITIYIGHTPELELNFTNIPDPRRPLIQLFYLLVHLLEFLCRTLARNLNHVAYHLPEAPPAPPDSPPPLIAIPQHFQVFHPAEEVEAHPLPTPPNEPAD